MTLPRIFCPECSTKLKSPSGFRIGETVCCPKCETYFTVEEPEADEVEESKEPDDDKKPRKKKKKKRDDEDKERSYRTSPLRFAVLGVLIVTMLVLAFLLYKKKMREREDNVKDAEPEPVRVGQLTPPIRPANAPARAGAGKDQTAGRDETAAIIQSIRSMGGAVVEREGKVVEISLKGKGLSDAFVISILRGLRGLSGSLRTADLSGNPITDQCLDQIRYLLLNVEDLRLDNTNVTDKGLGMLAETTTKLRTLSLVGDAGVTDNCVSSVSNMKQLKELHLSGTRVSSEAVEKLKKGSSDLMVTQDKAE